MPVVSAIDFMSSQPPRGRRRTSSMAPFADDLAQLRAKRYSLEELQSFLEKNDVFVTVSAISVFLKNQRKAAAEAARAASPELAKAS